jgi:hypothetical protein
MTAVIRTTILNNNNLWGDVLRQQEQKKWLTVPPARAHSVGQEFSMPDDFDFAGVLLLSDMSRLLKTGEETIRRRLRDKTFPIPPLAGVDHRLRWAGPVVQRWLVQNGRTSVRRPRRRRTHG